MRTWLAALVLSVSSAQAGHWIAPDWPGGKAPTFQPVHLYWFTVQTCPHVYRKEVDVPPGADRATVLLRTTGYAYVCVDGRQVYAWAPRKKTKDAPAVPADPNRVHEVDLTEHLPPGRHVLTVSAPETGFVLDGGLYAGTKRLAPLATDTTWTVTKLPPTTLVEDEAIVRPAYDGPKTPVKVVAAVEVGGTEEDTAWTADGDALARAHYRAAVKRLRRDLDDAVWRLQLLARKGIAIVGRRACGWGGPHRLDADLLASARDLLKQTGAADWPSRHVLPTEFVERLEKRAVGTARGLAATLRSLREARALIDRFLTLSDELSNHVRLADEVQALTLVSRNFAGPWPARVSPNDVGFAAVRAEMEKQFGHPLNRLNESRYDRLGWIDHPHLVDSDLGRWGVRIQPVTGPTTVQAHPRWYFSPDPEDKGVEQLRGSIGYNIEGQWPRIDATKSWNRDGRFQGHKGVAWYRTRIHVPAEWAGNEVVLALTVDGSERLWLNDHEVTKLGEGQGRRTFRLPPALVAFGAENYVAVRVEAEGEARGIRGTTEMLCPALEGDAGRETPPVDVLATPLSPCVVLTPQSDELHIHHAGKAKLLVPGSGLPIIERPEVTHKTLSNWVLLWLTPSTPKAVERPILLVFQHPPTSVVAAEGLTKVTFGAPRQRVVAVRPWVKTVPLVPKSLDVLRGVSFWSRAALAVPVNYIHVTRILEAGESLEGISIDRVPRGPVLGQTLVYDYLETKDDWGTKPLRLAPLPSLCSFAVDCEYRTLKLDREAETVQDGGLLAPYRAVTDTNKVSYSYAVEPWPRLAGFTSWMFSGADTGVLGNEREVELLAATGANSFRPQHNFSDEMPPKHLDPGGGRNRVQILVDYTAAAGMNYVNNIDQTLGGKREYVREHYDEFMEKVSRHYEKIAGMLHGRPFWAVAYDLINEPFDHHHTRYNPAMKALTRRVRALDRTHLCYVEPCEAWGAIQQLQLIEPTGDPLTVYSFHDYNFRLKAAGDRWPSLESDISTIYQMWLPAIEFQIRHGVCMHCGEFGGHHGPTDDSLAQFLLQNDFFRIFDQFGMHHHYYTGREVYQRLADGSLRPSNVVRGYRDYFARRDFNLYYPRWEGQPKPWRSP